MENVNIIRMMKRFIFIIKIEVESKINKNREKGGRK
jgi:hypothetical protein